MISKCRFLKLLVFILRKNANIRGISSNMDYNNLFLLYKIIFEKKFNYIGMLCENSVFRPWKMIFLTFS